MLWLDAGVRQLPWWEKVPNDDQIIEPKATINRFRRSSTG
jgi:hypothetical protein